MSYADHVPVPFLRHGALLSMHRTTLKATVHLSVHHAGFCLGSTGTSGLVYIIITK